MELPSEENTALRRCVRDLVALTTLPAVWTNYAPQQIAESLSDVLLGTLHLDLAYVSLNGTQGAIEVARTPERLYKDELAEELGIVLNAYAQEKTVNHVQTIANLLGAGTLRIAIMPVGHSGAGGVVVAGTQSPHLLTENDLLLLRVAANQAAIALQQAQLLTDLKAANEQKQQLLVQAQEAILMRDEFLSVAAHELKTPVTSQLGFAQLLLRQLNKQKSIEPNRLLSGLQNIARQSIKLNDLIGKLLDLSRIEAGRLVLDKRQVDLSALIREVVASVQQNTSKHNIQVRGLPSLPVLIDGLRIEQVLVNLLDNAIKYSPQGGLIDVELVMIDPCTTAFAVTDEGVGIPRERRERIFDRFYQAHGTGYLGGMGLGLYISCQIVELHGGTIRAEFPDKGGTRFIVSLPTNGSDQESR
jgi:signal transduction histidine kinase